MPEKSKGENQSGVGWLCLRKRVSVKSLVQYLVALVLVLIGIALLCNPSRPAQTMSQLQPDAGANSQMMDRTPPGPLMRLA